MVGRLLTADGAMDGGMRTAARIALSVMLDILILLGFE